MDFSDVTDTASLWSPIRLAMYTVTHTHTHSVRNVTYCDNYLVLNQNLSHSNVKAFIAALIHNFATLERVPV